MNNRNIFYRSLILSLLLTAFVSTSCKHQNTDTPFPDIKIGDSDASLSEISMLTNDEKEYALSGGTGKFDSKHVSVENSKIATAEIVTTSNNNVTTYKLRIKTLKVEGETFATLKSGDKVAKLTIKVVPRKLEFSQSELHIAPGEESKIVTLAGGGSQGPTITEEDTEDVIDQKLIDGNLIINAKREGDATITASYSGLKSVTLKIKVRITGDKDRVGYYSATSSNLGEVMNPTYTAYRQGKGYWLYNTQKPVGENRLFVSEFDVTKKDEPQEVEIIEPDSKETKKVQLYIVSEESDYIKVRWSGFRAYLPRK